MTLPSTPISLLDCVRKTHGLTSDYQAAKLLRVSRATLSTWRTGRDSPSDAVALKLADALKLSPGYVLCICHAARAREDGARKEWTALASRLAADNVLTTG